MQIISELEGYRRGPTAGAVGYALPDGDLDTCIAIRTIVLHRRDRLPPGGRRDRRRLRPERRARGVPAQAGRPRARDYAGGAMILLVDNYDSFTYNLVHLFQELGAEVVVRRNDEIDADEAERLRTVASRRLARPRAARGLGRDRRDRPPARADDADARRLPRPPGDRRGLRRRDRPGAASSCTARRARSRTTARHLRRAATALPGRPLPLARRDQRARASWRSRRRPPTAR